MPLRETEARLLPGVTYAEIPLVRDLFASCDLDGKTVFGRRERTGRQIRIRAREVGRSIEIESQRPVISGLTNHERAIGRPGSSAGREIGEEDIEPLTVRAAKNGEGQGLTINFELDLARGFVNVTNSFDGRSDFRFAR